MLCISLKIELPRQLFGTIAGFTEMPLIGDLPPFNGTTPREADLLWRAL